MQQVVNPTGNMKARITHIIAHYHSNMMAIGIITVLIQALTRPLGVVMIMIMMVIGDTAHLHVQQIKVSQSIEEQHLIKSIFNTTGK